MKHFKRLTTTAFVAAFAALSLARANDELPSVAEMWKIIQQQQVEIDALKGRLGSTEVKVEATDAKVEATGAYVENLGASGGAAPAGDAWYTSTQIGGYGELHANFGANDEIDFHRFVLYAGHDFNDTTRFFSEIELEHSIAGEGKAGEFELEQAFLEFDIDETSKARAGLFLLPIGIMNETHEPDTFYGVERNLVEKNIIPSTWWEAGAAYNKEYENGVSFDAAIHSGLSTPISGSKAFNIRSGRQKVAKAKADDLASTVRVTYAGIPGVKFGLSAQYQQDLAQGLLSETVDATLVSAHMDYERDGFGLRALYARWDLGGAAPAVLGVDEQFGYYIEPSYRFGTEAGDIGVFARYSAYDNQANSAFDTEDSFIDLGLNFWPTQQIVLKADVQFTDFANKRDEEILNLGVGYQF